MNLKRIVSLILALMLAVNTPAALAADAHAGAADGLRRHTVTLTADTLTGKRLPLESAPSSMKDQGDYLHNAEGVVDAQIQGTYYAKRKAGLCIFSRDQLFVCAADAGRLLSAAQRIARTIGIARTQRIARALRISATK